MRIALTIAGSDSSAGAGIQADLKTFAAHGVFGISAITAITAQNTLGIVAAAPLEADLVTAQIEAVVSDMGVHAAQTGMLANAAMNGAILDTTFNFFVKFKYSKAYDAMLATPLDAQDVALGEVAWSLLRGAVYAVGFLVVMALFGLTPSFWAVLGLPVALLVGFAFAGAGLGATTYMRSYLDFDKVAMVMVPLFLFSATFFPLERYPDGLAAVIRWTPLYQGVVLARSVTLGDIHPSLLLNALYLLVMGWAGTRVASRRIAKLLQP